MSRTIESIYEELVVENVIKKPENINLDQYYGEYSYLGTSLRDNMVEPQPSLADVKQLVTLYAILPLGEQLLDRSQDLEAYLIQRAPNLCFHCRFPGCAR